MTLVALHRPMTDAEFAAESEQRRIEEERDSRRSRLERSGIQLPDAIREAVIRREQADTPAVLEVRKWAKPLLRPWLILAGTVGTGKTTAAGTAIASVGGDFIRARELERLSKAAFGAEAERLAALKATRLLVIDDLGRESDTARMAVTLEDLLDERCTKQRVTILTTNFDASALRERYPDERLHSRLFQLARFAAFDGADLRREPLRGDHA